MYFLKFFYPQEEKEALFVFGNLALAHNKQTYGQIVFNVEQELPTHTTVYIVGTRTAIQGFLAKTATKDVFQYMVEMNECRF